VPQGVGGRGGVWRAGCEKRIEGRDPHCSAAFYVTRHRPKMVEGRSPKFIWAPCHVMCTAVLIG
jgi:hypothetical protein